MKKQKNLLIKVLTNKYILLITPYLLFITLYLNYYVYAEKYDYNLPISALFKYYILIFIILALFNIVLNTIFKNRRINYFLMMIIVVFFYKIISIKRLVFIIIMILFLSLTLKKIQVKDSIIVICNTFIIFLFLICFVPASYRMCDLLNNTNHTEVDYKVKTDSSIKEKPNIYYIHCDGMMSMEALRKYFNYNDTYLNDYLENNDFLINRNTILPLGYRTQKALVALFNPYYYDNKEKYFLEEVEKYTDNNKNKVRNYIGYQELKEKRLNNEFIIGLSNGGYKTYAVGLYNQYTSLNTDYFYDYNYYRAHNNHFKKGLKLRIVDNNVDKKMLNEYINMQILADIYPGVSLFDNIDYSKFEKGSKVLNKQNINLNDYKYLNNASSEKINKIIESLSDIQSKNDKNRFVFVDYDLNHLNVSLDKNTNNLIAYAPFDIAGNEIIEYNNFKTDYKESYTYLSYLLVDLIKYIKNNDKNSIIIIQGDHGIHVKKCDEMIKDINIEKDECHIIRNSVISAIYIPNEYKSKDGTVLNNPLNFSRYIINNYVGKNYTYLK